jgi:16S rRNA (guanine(966)-N(2))-methyltransferase RsmD
VTGLRVIAGTHKGRRLAAPTWPGLRPTSDRLRETLFDILGARVAGARLLDVFAGTGAVGIEAISRGAVHVTLVEADARAVALIGRNLAGCGITAGYTVVARGWPLAGAEGRFATQAVEGHDLVFLDPPYEWPGLDEALAAGADAALPGGVVVIEHARRRAVPERTGRDAAWRRVREVRAGDSALSFYSQSG